MTIDEHTNEYIDEYDYAEKPKGLPRILDIVRDWVMAFLGIAILLLVGSSVLVLSFAFIATVFQTITEYNLLGWFGLVIGVSVVLATASIIYTRRN